MTGWLGRLRLDPVPVLLTAGDTALTCFVRRDLLSQEAAGPLSVLWELPEPLRLLRRQRADGSWRYPGGNPETTPGGNYAVLETYRSLGVLADEPTAKVDTANGRQAMEIMQRLNQPTGTAFIFATHDPRVVAYARRVVKLRDGQGVDNGANN